MCVCKWGGGGGGNLTHVCYTFLLTYWHLFSHSRAFFTLRDYYLLHPARLLQECFTLAFMESVLTFFFFCLLVWPIKKNQEKKQNRKRLQGTVNARSKIAGILASCSFPPLQGEILKGQPGRSWLTPSRPLSVATSACFHQAAARQSQTGRTTTLICPC